MSRRGSNPYLFGGVAVRSLPKEIRELPVDHPDKDDHVKNYLNNYNGGSHPVNLRSVLFVVFLICVFALIIFGLPALFK